MMIMQAAMAAQALAQAQAQAAAQAAYQASIAPFGTGGSSAQIPGGTSPGANEPV